MSTPLRAALTIAGSDSSGGAGVQADLKTFAALGIYGMSAITAITAQNTLGIMTVEPLAADLVTDQIEAIAGDITIHVTKIGMLATAAIVEAVAATIEELELPLVVVDPVLLATSGVGLLDDDGIQALRAELLPRAFVVTPNIPEAEILSGSRILTVKDAHEAAKRIHGLGPTAVIVKGGHGSSDVIVDVMFDGDRIFEFQTPRIPISNVHGTGCTFASAIAAHLALDSSLSEAITRAQIYLAGAISQSLAVGHGQRMLDHFWLKP